MYELSQAGSRPACELAVLLSRFISLPFYPFRTGEPKEYRRHDVAASVKLDNYIDFARFLSRVGYRVAQVGLLGKVTVRSSLQAVLSPVVFFESLHKLCRLRRL